MWESILDPTLPLTCEVLVGKLLNLPFPSAAFRNVNDEYPTLVCVLLLFYFVSIKGCESFRQRCMN